ncbi:putative transcription factor C2C2-CO-like family [Helianthus annuus]|nr:putative transcription factor C2C2-CO-like family [Helianthus annuus]
MLAGKKTANAVGGKTARACDSCVRKRARWYCAADDAFLCQSCDASVHSANQLAGRHERVLLETVSKSFGSGEPSPEPTWHQGFTRRARTPRQRTKYSPKLEGKNEGANSTAALVPEIGVLEASLLDDEEEEEQEELLYRVPVYDPFETELCNASSEKDRSLPFIGEDKKEDEACNLDDLQGFDLPNDDLEFLDFAADVESLLGKGFNDTSCRIEDLGLTNSFKDDEDNSNYIGVCFDENRVKVEDREVEAMLGFDLDATRETLDHWDFDYDHTSMMIKEEEKKVVAGVELEHMTMVSNDHCDNRKMKTSSITLRLNYEDVINAWADQGSPWTNGARPEINLDGSWPDFMGFQWAGNNIPSYGGVGGSDGGREARVSRYREKRRTRLFSKKIRYEVRKLNAEKRPRMKGRFVKRNL